MTTGKILVLALAALMVLAPLAAAAPSFTTSQTKIDARINPDLLRGGETYSVSIIVTNLDDLQSVEKIVVLLNYTGQIFSDPAAVGINNVTIFDENNTLRGSWSYEVKNLTVDGTTYLALIAYTSPGTLPLQYNWYANITFNLPVTTEGGYYYINVTTYHIDSDFNTVYHDSALLEVMVDSAAPEYTVIYPGFNGTHYFTTLYQDELGNYYTIFQFELKDTIDGVNYLNLSKYPLNITDLQVSHGTPTTSQELSADYETLYFNVKLNFTTTPPAEGTEIWVAFNVADTAGHVISVNITAIVDTTPPTITLDGVYYSYTPGTGPSDPVYFDGTTYWANRSVYLVFTVTDNYALNMDSVRVIINETVYTPTYDSATDYFYLEINASDYSDGASITPAIVAVDYAGNSQTATPATITFDFTPPTLNVSVDTTTLNPGTLYIYNSGVNLSLSASDAGSGFNSAASSIILYNFTRYNDATPAAEQTLAWTTNLLLNQEGYYEVEVTVYDYAGNSATFTYLVIVDLNAPANVTYLISEVNACGGAYYTNSDVVVLKITFWDVSNVTITVDFNGTLLYAGEFYPQAGDTGVLAVLDISTLSEGMYIVTITLTDDAGWVTGETFTLYIDRTAPALDAGTSNLDDYNGMVVDPNYNDTYYTLAFTDETRLQDTFTVYHNNVNVTSFVTSTWATDYTGVILNLSGIENLYDGGEHNITVVLVDCAGNTFVYTVTYYVDVKPPALPEDFIVEDWTAGTITFNGVVSDDYRVDSLTLEVYDNDTLLATIDLFTALGLTPAKDINLTGLTINLGDYITLTDGANYTLVLKARDYYSVEYGVEDERHTANTTDYVAVDFTPPVFTPPSETHLGCFNTDPYTIKINVTDAASGINASSIAVYVDGAPATFTYTEYDGVYEISVEVSGYGEHNITITVSDALGNEATAWYTVFIDTLPPAIEFAASAGDGFASITNLNITDDCPPEAFTITLSINGSDYTFTLPLGALNENYAIATTTDYFTLDTYEDLSYFIGSLYAEAANAGAIQPFLAIIKGKIYVFTGLQNEDYNATITVAAVDAAGNANSTSVTLEIAAGAMFPVKLYQGWNLLSLPMQTPEGSYNITEIADWLDTDVSNGSIAVIYLYTDEGWIGYIPGVGSIGANLSDIPLITDGMAFWVKYVGASEGFILMPGYLPYTQGGGDTPMLPITYTLQPGGNFLGFTSAAPLPIGFYLESLSDQADSVYDYVFIFNAERQMWYVVPFYSSRDYLFPGMGMWIYAYQEATVIVPVWYSGALPW